MELELLSVPPPVIAWLVLLVPQEPTKSCCIRTKDAPITLEILRDLGALCQKLGAKTKYICVYISFIINHSITLMHMPKF